MKIKLQNFLKFIPGTHKKEKIVELHPAHEIPLTATSLHSMSLFHADKQNQTDRMNHVNHAGATAPPFFERRVDEVDLKKSMELFHFLSHIFHKNSVAWCLMFGSLAGQHFFHGIIPWDDDWDVLAVAEPDRIEALLIAGVKDTPSLEFYRHKEAGFFKVFHKSSINAGQHPWKWPFVDIFYSKTGKNTLTSVKMIEKFHNICFSIIFAIKTTNFWI